MRNDHERHHRRSIRLKDYDYAQAGAYFITLVTLRRENLFGEIANGVMRLNPWGEIACEEWLKSGRLRENVRLEPDEFVVMPNHVHGIIWIMDASLQEETNLNLAVARAERLSAPADPDHTAVRAQRLSAPADPDHTAVRAQRRCAPTDRSAPTEPTDRSASTEPADRCAPTAPTGPRVVPQSLGAIVRGYKSAVTYRINAARQERGSPIWQRNYYEHVIRNDAELSRIRLYIQTNPLRWEADQLQPATSPNRFNRGH